MRVHKLWLILGLLSLALLAGCQKAEVSQPVDTGSSDPAAQFGTGVLDPTNSLILGTLMLEDGAERVTPEQAANLLPLWQVIQTGSLQSTAETDAVLKQIEGTMTDPQLAAIDAMSLTREDMTAWMAEQGIEMPAFTARPEGAPGDGTGGGPGAGGGGGFGQMGDMTEEERAQMREQFQALQDLTPEERAKRLEEMGIQVPEGADAGQFRGGGANPGGFARGGNFLLTPLLELLTERAAE